MSAEPKPMHPERLNRLQDSATGCADYDSLVAELLRDRDHHAQRAAEAEQRAGAAERDRDMFRTRAKRYEAVLSELPPECWPEYDGAPAVARLVASARQAEAAVAEVKRLKALVGLEPSDVDQAVADGLTGAKVRRWLVANKVAFSKDWTGEIEARWLVRDIRWWAKATERSAFTILEEMLAMEVTDT